MRENHIQVHGGVLGECCALVGQVTSRASRPWVWTSQMMCSIVGKDGSVRQEPTSFWGEDKKNLKKKADFVSGVEGVEGHFLFLLELGFFVCVFF